MGNLNTRASHRADTNRLGDGGLERGALVPHVGRVNAARVGGDAREVDDFRNPCVGSGDVLQAGREPDGAVRHRPPDERLHPVQLRQRRNAIGGAHHRLADGVVADERREIYRGTRLTDLGEGFADIQRGRTAVASDDRRDSHPDEVLGSRMIGQIVGMCVHVDEAWRDDQACRIDDLTRRGARDVPDGHDAAVLDPDVSETAGSA